MRNLELVTLQHEITQPNFLLDAKFVKSILIPFRHYAYVATNNDIAKIQRSKHGHTKKKRRETEKLTHLMIMVVEQ